MTVRHVLRVDLPAIEQTLSAAFYDDPVTTFLLPDPSTRLEAAATSFFRVFLQAGLRRGHTYCTADLGAAAIWAPPEIAAISDEEGTALAVALSEHAGPSAIERLIALGEAVRTHHPAQPHFYLGVVGVHPRHQGEGVGAALLGPVLQRCDDDGLPAYLESSNPRNVSFYARLGFTVIHEIPVEGGPTLAGMWRAALSA